MPSSWDVARPFVGRARVKTELVSVLAGGARVVSIAGPPGVGKTRLAVEAIDAPVICALAGRTENEVRSALSAAASAGSVVLADGADETLDTVRATIDALLPVSKARFVVTSRPALPSPRAIVIRLGPLPLPHEDDAPSDALDLFVARLGPAGALGPAARREAMKIVRATGGLPLVIELAAADARVLGLAELARRTGRATRVGPAVRDAVARSWRLLSSEQRHVLEAVAFFRHGASAADVEGATEREAALVIGALEVLVDGSLLRCWRTDDDAQAPLHECPTPLREAVLELAAASEEFDAHRALQRRHVLRRTAAGAISAPGDLGNAVDAIDAALTNERSVDAARALLGLRPIAGGTLAFTRYAEMLERARTELPDEAGAPLRGRIDAALAYAERRGGRLHDSIDTAVRGSARHRDPEARYALGIEHGIALVETGAFQDAVDVLREIVARRAPSAADRARALRALATAQLRLHDNDGADVTLRLALEVASARERAAIHVNLGDVCAERGRSAEAREHYARAREAAGPAPRPFDVFVELKEAALLHGDGHLDEALAAYAEATRDALARGDEYYAAAARLYAGLALVARGDLAAGERELAVARDAMRRADDVHHQTLCACALAVAALRRHAADEARAHVTEALRCAASSSKLVALIADAVAGWVELENPRSPRAHSAIRARLLEISGPRTRVFHRGLPAPISLTIDARTLVMARGPHERATVLTGKTLRAHPAGEWIELPSGKRLAAPQARAALRLVACLVYGAVRDPEQPVPSEVLIAAAWPDEKLDPRVGHNRLHVAIHQLRTWSLGATIERLRRRGYRLRPEVALDLALS